MNLRRMLLLGIGLVVLLAVFWAIGSAQPAPLDERTVSLAAFLRERGIDVSFAAVPSSDRTAFLLHDLRSPDQAGDLLEWVKGGGTLVVTDPASATLSALGVEPQSGLGTFGSLADHFLYYLGPILFGARTSFGHFQPVAGGADCLRLLFHGGRRRALGVQRGQQEQASECKRVSDHVFWIHTFCNHTSKQKTTGAVPMFHGVPDKL